MEATRCKNSWAGPLSCCLAGSSFCCCRQCFLFPCLLTYLLQWWWWRWTTIISFKCIALLSKAMEAKPNGFFSLSKRWSRELSGQRFIGAGKNRKNEKRNWAAGGYFSFGQLSHAEEIRGSSFLILILILGSSNNSFNVASFFLGWKMVNPTTTTTTYQFLLFDASFLKEKISPVASGWFARDKHPQTQTQLASCNWLLLLLLLFQCEGAMVFIGNKQPVSLITNLASRAITISRLWCWCSYWCIGANFGQPVTLGQPPFASSFLGYIQSWAKLVWRQRKPHGTKRSVRVWGKLLKRNAMEAKWMLHKVVVVVVVVDKWEAKTRNTHMEHTKQLAKKWTGGK